MTEQGVGIIVLALVLLSATATVTVVNVSSRSTFLIYSVVALLSGSLLRSSSVHDTLTLEPLVVPLVFLV